MKQLIISLLIALIVHGIILSADISWLKGFSRDHVSAKSVTITLLAPRQNKIHKQTLPAIAKPPQDKILPVPQKKIDKIPQTQDPIPIDIQKPESPEISPQSNTPPDIVEPKAVPVPVLSKSSLKALTKSKSKRDVKKTPRPDSDVEAAKMPLSDPESAHVSGNQPQSQNQNLTKALNTQNASVQTAAIDKPATPAAIQLARPLYKKNPSPKYPRRARKLRYEGVVILDVQVDENGKVNDLKILESSGYEILDKAAVSSVKRWLFEPGTRNGEKVKMWVSVPIRFQLN